MNIELILIEILLIHFIADFVLQTHKQATGKGEGKKFFNKWLFYHVGVYSLVWLVATIPTFGIYSILFATITFICHYLTDWCTSRVGKPFWKKGDFHNGFVVVGFDQILHYIQLYFTFKYLLLNLI